MQGSRRKTDRTIGRTPEPVTGAEKPSLPDRAMSGKPKGHRKVALCFGAGVPEAQCGQPSEKRTMGMPLQKMSLQEFLGWENNQAERHEFLRGEVFAMVGARRTHGRVVLNIATRLALHLAGTRCQVFSEGMKVQIADDTIFYPDIFVTCDAADLRTEMVFRAPVLVVEVLSPGTVAYDRGQKFSLYRRLASLKEYLLVDPDTRRVEAFRRNEQDQWVLHDMSEGDVLEVACLEAKVTMAQVFDGVTPEE
jgi:Uma2 family endonuclease